VYNQQQSVPDPCIDEGLAVGIASHIMSLHVHSEYGHILDHEDAESVDFIKDGSEVGDHLDGIATYSHSAPVSPPSA